MIRVKRKKKTMKNTNIYKPRHVAVSLRRKGLLLCQLAFCLCNAVRDDQAFDLNLLLHQTQKEAVTDFTSVPKAFPAPELYVTKDQGCL